MMKLKSVLFIVCLLQGAMTLNATIVQKLVLKNGSELEGYISKQRPGSNFTFVAEKAVIYMPGTEVKNIFDNEIKIKDLSPAWIKWAEKNDAFQGIGDDRVLTLSNIVTEKKTDMLVPDRPEHAILHGLVGCLLSDCPKQPTIQYMLYTLRYHKKSVQKSNTKTK